MNPGITMAMPQKCLIFALKQSGMSDDWNYTPQRKKLVEGLAQKGIHDPAVLKAIGRVPRHLFVDSFLKSRAYDDQALPIARGQTISQPYTVAFQTQLLAVKPHYKILEIGTGSGYQSAVLAEMGARVYSIERLQFLFNYTARLLHQLHYPVHTVYGDGARGLPDDAPFHGILITAATAQVPAQLLNQLQPGGHLVAPIGDRQRQQMTRITRISENEFEKETFGFFMFVPLKTGTE